MFISPAYAQSLTDAQGLVQLLPLVLIFVVFYFLLIRPQQKRMKEHKAMLAAVRRGDRVVTGGGFIGTVTKVVGDDEAIVEIAEGVRVRVVKSTITSVLAKTGSASDTEDDEPEVVEGKKKRTGGTGSGR